MKTKHLATAYAITAAALYAINVPFSKLLLTHIPPTVLAAFLYLGAGLGMLIYSVVPGTAGKAASAESLTRKELPYTAAMVILDIAAPMPIPIRIFTFTVKTAMTTNTRTTIWPTNTCTRIRKHTVFCPARRFSGPDFLRTASHAPEKEENPLTQNRESVILNTQIIDFFPEFSIKTC